MHVLRIRLPPGLPLGSWKRGSLENKKHSRKGDIWWVHALARVTGKNGFVTHFLFLLSVLMGNKSGWRCVLLSDGTTKTRDCKCYAAKQQLWFQHGQIVSGLLWWHSLFLRKPVSQTIVEQCVLNPILPSERNVRLCGFSIVTASLYLNNVFGDICPRLHRIISVLGALGTLKNIVLFCSMQGAAAGMQDILKLTKANYVSHVCKSVSCQ